ncbi:hypothetical protein E2F46_06405 [Luteimonas aestuarii]|uniref:Uncharacterized protein n=1 Tax=Luteimonas aestuarii TaxID=453837 RepID=A0A4R5TYE2_9GAMM|nr:hypothetical protein [Luteimonas aestuarii]TDK26225.1 hypothetical protein E2F46_06405 [Luteimonas aestuarii]
MSLTIGLTGMDPATEAALKSALMAANESLNSHWRLVPESEAEHIVVDMDSMYGPMSWLRLHAAGKKIVGLTSAPRAQTDFRLGRPFDEASAAALLTEISAKAGVDLTQPAASPAASAAPAAESPAPMVAAETDMPPAVEAAPALIETPARPVAVEAPPPPPSPAPEPEPPAPAPEPPPPEPPRDRTLADWLAPGLLPGRVRYRRPSGPILLIDTAAGQYHGPATLKPLAGYFDGPVSLHDFEQVGNDDWDRESATAGAVQSLSRLLWLGGLMAGKGKLLPGLDPEGRYRLSRFPQTEREYPRHFRISTAMMRGPATLAEIAAASGVPVEDVADFVNANLSTGFAEFVPEAPPEPTEPPKPGGLFGRLRGK